jgi:hypothetical protein
MIIRINITHFLNVIKINICNDDTLLSLEGRNRIVKYLDCFIFEGLHELNLAKCVRLERN